jgi:hypothetical protein
MKLKSSSPVTWQKICLREKKTSEKGCYSLIIHTYFLVVDSDTTTPFFCKLWNTIYREIINIRTIMMKTIKKRLNLYTKNILIGWRSCLFLEKKLWKGMLFSDNTYILFGCRLLVCIANWSYTSCQNGQFTLPSQGVMEIVCYL